MRLTHHFLKLRHPVTVTAIWLPVIIYFFYAVSHTSTLFFADDFHLLKTIVWLKEESHPVEKLKLFFHQHNEHRIIVPRFLTWLDFKLEKHINWVTLTALANLVWIGVLWIFWKAFQSLSLPKWMFIPVPWMLLHPQYVDNVTWTISILQQSDVIFLFGLLAYLCSVRRYYWALPVALIATFTHGNGIFCFATGLSYILMDRRWKAGLCWFAVMVVTALFYFDGFKAGQNANIGQSLAAPGQLLASFGAFFGGLTRILSSDNLYAVILGWVMIAVLSLYMLPKIIRKLSTPRKNLSLFDSILWGNLAFLLITGLLVVVTRSWSGVDTIIAPRYLHYTSFVACWVYLVVIRQLPSQYKSAHAAVFITGALILNGLSYLTYHPQVVYREDTLTAEETNYLNHGRFLDYHWTFNRNIGDTYRTALEEGIIRMKRRLPDIAAPGEPPVRPENIAFHLTFPPPAGEVSDRKEGSLWISSPEAGDDHMFLYFQPGSGPGYWVATCRSRPAFRDLLTKGSLTGKGFHSSVIYENLPLGDYRVGIWRRDQFYWTQYKITVGNSSLTIH